MMAKKIPYKIYLEESEMPKDWYNVRADMKIKPAPLLDPATHEPMTAEQFARVEGILPAPESSHAIRVAIDEAMKCKETGEEKTILFGLTGTGYFDMVAYEKFHNGEMEDYIPTDADLQAGLDGLPQF